MATAKKDENHSSIIRIGLFIVSLLLICFTAIAYLNHRATSIALKNIPAVSVRPATPADYPFYIQLYPDLDIDQPPSTSDTWIKHDVPNTSIITYDAIPVGYAWVQLIGEVYYLTHFVVAREHRRKGIGTAALKLLKKTARGKGFKKWGLHCDVTHTIPYKLYLKAGMHPNGELFHLKAPSGTIKTLDPHPKDYYTMIVNDPGRWTELEKEYKIMPGEIALSVQRGRLPVLMLDANQRVKGFTVMTPTSGTLWDLYIENSEDLAIFMNLLQVYRMPPEADDDGEWNHFWIANEGCKQMGDIVLQTLPGAAICEKYDYLEGSTLDTVQ